jgi:hypothetical protein
MEYLDFQENDYFVGRFCILLGGTEVRAGRALQPLGAGVSDIQRASPEVKCLESTSIH